MSLARCMMATLALAALAWAEGEPPAPAPAPAPAQPHGLIAPDGVPYASAEAAEVMRMKPLSGNLVRNGSFEQGRFWPYEWDPVDRLGTLWIEGGTDGRRCVQLYTDLLEEQWVPWNEKVLATIKEASRRTNGRPQALRTNPLPEPPLPLLTRAPYYNTVGGLHGIHYRCEFVPVKPGAIYRLSVDARFNGGKQKVFLKGFIDQRRKTEEGVQVLKRNAWRAPMHISGSGGKWMRFARLGHPARSKSTFNAKPIQPQWLRVELYAYWPVGRYNFNNVRLEIVGHEPIEHTPADKAPADRAGPEPAPDGGDEEFPVFR